MKQIEPHIGIRKEIEYIYLLSEIGFKNINIFHIPHYIFLFEKFHFLSKIPIIGKFFNARLFISCEK